MYIDETEKDISPPSDSSQQRTIPLTQIIVKPNTYCFKKEFKYDFKSPFTVIIGRNGVGKTKLLTLIQEAIINKGR